MALTHALTRGRALLRQASLLPPLRMHAMKIGLPNVLRQFSMIRLLSTGEA